MTDYEIELGSVTERWNAKTDAVFAVSVDVLVRAIEDGLGEPRSGSYTVRFDVDENVARFDSVDAGSTFNDLALVAVSAAADRLRELSDSYDVVDPIETVQSSEYAVLD